MDTISIHDVPISDVEIDPEDGFEAVTIDEGALEDASSEKEVIREVGSAVIRLKLDIACCSEKLVNINLLMMHVASRESDFEDFVKDNSLVDSDGKALEFDVLSGIFDLEIREMDSFIDIIKSEINNTCEVISSQKHLGEGFSVLEEKLNDAEVSIKQSQEHVSDLMMQSTKFQKILSSANHEENSDEDKEVIISGDDDFFNTTTKQKTSQQQRHILRMLEKSLARELELENELEECFQARDDLKHKIHFSQQKFMSAEEITAAVYSRFLEADSASAVLMGISKELIGKLQSYKLQINSALRQENKVNTKLQECTQTIQILEKKDIAWQELAEKNRLEASALMEKVNILEEQRKVSESALVNRNIYLDGMSEQINELEEKFFVAESWTQKAEAESKLLAEAYKELNEELDLLKNRGVSVKKLDFLEKQLRETEIQLQDARASVEASQEKQSLYSSINDMEILIEKLKSKVLEANAHADSAEYKCIMLSESHAELSQEVIFLKDKIQCLEASLQQAEETKWRTAKDMNICSKVITDMVMQLATERERLHKQLSLLVMENRALVNKLNLLNKVSSNFMNHEGGETEMGALSSEHHVHSADVRKGHKEDSDTKVDSEDVLDSECKSETQDSDSKLETVRTIDAGRLNYKYVFSAIIVASVAVLVMCFFQAENCPF